MRPSPRSAAYHRLPIAAKQRAQLADWRSQAPMERCEVCGIQAHLAEHAPRCPGRALLGLPEAEARAALAQSAQNAQGATEAMGARDEPGEGDIEAQSEEHDGPPGVEGSS